MYVLSIDTKIGDFGWSQPALISKSLGISRHLHVADLWANNG